jgi:hypothetical protein
MAEGVSPEFKPQYHKSMISNQYLVGNARKQQGLIWHIKVNYDCSAECCRFQDKNEVIHMEKTIHNFPGWSQVISVEI